MARLKVFVGIDWGSAEHQVHVIQETGEDSTRVAHDGSAIRKLMDRLEKLATEDSEEIGVAIERKYGPLVEALLDRGFSVFSINPKQLDRFRDRHSVAGAKDDRLDAFVLAQSLMTDRRCYRQLAAEESALVELRSLNREREGLNKDRLQRTNRLRDQLWRYYPQILELSPGADEAWVWDLLELAPTPTAGASLKRAEVAEVLKRRRIKRLNAREVIKCLRKAPVFVAPGVVEGATGQIRRLVQQLWLLREQIKEVEGALEQALERLQEPTPPDQGEAPHEHRDAEIALSFPGAGTVVVATLLAEASDAIARRDYQQLRALSGVAPVRRSTGRRDSPHWKGPIPATMRRAKNGRLSQALHWWAFVAIRRDKAARAQYDALRGRGHNQARALRSVGDRLLRLLTAALRNGTLYDTSNLRGTYAQAA